VEEVVRDEREALIEFARRAEIIAPDDDSITRFAPYVSITPETRDALVEVAEAAHGVIQKTEDEDGLEWVSLTPAGQQRLWKALMALGFDV
jgi:hypothetical protein